MEGENACLGPWTGYIYLSCVDILALYLLDRIIGIACV